MLVERHDQQQKPSLNIEPFRVISEPRRREETTSKLQLLPAQINLLQHLVLSVFGARNVEDEERAKINSQ